MISEKYTNVVSTPNAAKKLGVGVFLTCSIQLFPLEWLLPFSMEASILTARILLLGRRNSPVAPQVLFYTEPC